MRRVKYNGPPRKIGRFGKVETGQEIELSEDEFKSVVNEENYELLDDPRDHTDPSFPQATSHFDLRDIDWTKNQLEDWMRTRSMTDITKIALGMIELGSESVYLDDKPSRDILIQRVVSYAYEEGWHLL